MSRLRKLKQRLLNWIAATIVTLSDADDDLIRRHPR